MNPALATRLPFEMLHRVGDINIVTIDPGFAESAVEKLSRRADEQLPSEILLIARLLAQKHDRRALRTFTKHGLRSELVQMTGGATSRRGRNFGQVVGLRHRSGMPLGVISWTAAFAVLFRIMRSTLRGACCSSDGISAASGRFRQYFFGISASIACTFTRAGLKILA